MGSRPAARLTIRPNNSLEPARDRRAEMGAGLADVAGIRTRGGVGGDGANDRRASRHCGARMWQRPYPGGLSSRPLGGASPRSTVDFPNALRGVRCIR